MSIIDKGESYMCLPDHDQNIFLQAASLILDTTLQVSFRTQFFETTYF